MKPNWVQTNIAQQRTWLWIGIPYQQHLLATPYHEFRNTEPSHLTRRNARFVANSHPKISSQFFVSSCTEDTLRWPAGTQLCPSGLCCYPTSHAWRILLCLHDCTYPLTISISLKSYFLSQIKRKNDQTVLKYGKSKFFLFNLYSHHWRSLQLNHQHLW